MDRFKCYFRDHQTEVELCIEMKRVPNPGEIIQISNKNYRIHNVTTEIISNGVECGYSEIYLIDTTPIRLVQTEKDHWHD